MLLAVRDQSQPGLYSEILSEKATFGTKQKQNKTVLESFQKYLNRKIVPTANVEMKNINFREWLKLNY